jgi:hypothetical protein
MEENKRFSNLLQSRILSVSSSSCLLRRLASLIFSSFWNPFLQTNQAKHQPITLYMLPFLQRSSSRTRKVFFFFHPAGQQSGLQTSAPTTEPRSKQTEIWRPCVGGTSKLRLYEQAKQQQAEWCELTAMRGGCRRSGRRSRPAPR